MTIKGVIWDCDGVLVDSEKIAMRVAAQIVNQALKDGGKPGIDEDAFVVEYAGKHFMHMVQDCGLDDTNGHLETLKMQRTIEELSKHVDTFSGLFEVLTNLKAKGVKLAVATSSELSRVLPCLDKHGLTEFFKDNLGVPHIYSAMDSLETPSLKPKPDIYIHACKNLGLAAADVVAVEDSPSGVQSARSADLRVVAFIGASHIPLDQKHTHTESLLRAAGIDGIIGVIDDYTKVPDFSAFVASSAGRQLSFVQPPHISPSSLNLRN